MTSSEDSWPSDHHFSPSQLRPSPTPSLPHSSSSSSSTEDRIPLSRRQVLARASIRGRRAAAGPSSRASGESPEGSVSSMTGQDLANIRAQYRIPASIRLFPPTPDDRVTSSRTGRVALYEVFFRAGLRFPLHPFITDLLNRYNLILAQLVPNSIRTICIFLVLCHREGVEPYFSLFRAFYTIRRQGGWWQLHPRPLRTLRMGLPSSVKGWKTRFFFADLGGGRGGWGDPNEGPNKNNRIVPRDEVAFQKLLSAEIPRFHELLSEESLRLAGLFPSGGERPKRPSDLSFYLSSFSLC